MPRSSPNKTKPAREMQPTSGKLELIDSWLQKMLDRFPQKGTISVDEIQDWHQDLSHFSSQAIDFAFETHRRNALFFPMPGQILDLCVSYDPPATTKCDALCKARHYRGYSETDVKYLWEIYQKKLESLPNRPMTDGEIESLLDLLDKKRGHAPDWRKTA